VKYLALTSILTPGARGPVHEIVVDHLLEKLLAHEVDQGRVLDGRSLAVDAAPAVFLGVVDVLGEVIQVHAEEHVERDMAREDIVDRVQDGYSPRLQIGVDDPARHPVVGMDDEPAAVAGAHGLMTLLTISRWNSAALSSGLPP